MNWSAALGESDGAANVFFVCVFMLIHRNQSDVGKRGNGRKRKPPCEQAGPDNKVGPTLTSQITNIEGKTCPFIKSFLETFAYVLVHMQEKLGKYLFRGL